MLMFWVKSDNEDKGRDEDWEEIQSEKKQEDQNDSDDAEDEEIEDEDLFQEFLEKNTKEAKSGKITCKFCDKKFSYEGITKHFIKTHEKEYEATEFSKEVKWKEAIEINKRLEKKMEDQFMKMTMGGFGFDMDDEEEDFDFDSMFKGKKGKSKGKGKSGSGRVITYVALTAGSIVLLSIYTFLIVNFLILNYLCLLLFPILLYCSHYALHGERGQWNYQAFWL
jgi:hypothetical protein